MQELIRNRTIDELNIAAEDYFRTRANWDFHLAKPFGNIADAPALLINLAIVLQGLDLRPGHRVLDFGAGSGWTAHYLTQLGCEVVLLDVSETALQIARERFRRQPIVGRHIPPQYLVFDGRTIELPTASVDRILCFDAFHHVPNPDHVIQEFARILMTFFEGARRSSIGQRVRERSWGTSVTFPCVGKVRNNSTAEIAIHHAEVLPDERAVHVAATVRNAGQAIWLPSATPYGGVSLGCHLLDEEGTMEVGSRPATVRVESGEANEESKNEE